MKSILRNKKAISPLIATVLLILLAIAGFGVVFMWMKGFIAEQNEKFGSPLEAACSSVAFAADYENNMIAITNQGNIPIIGMNVKYEVDRSTMMKNIIKPIDGVIDIGETDSISVASLDGFDSAQSKTLSPVIQGKGIKTGKMKKLVCKEAGKNI